MYRQTFFCLIAALTLSNILLAEPLNSSIDIFNLPETIRIRAPEYPQDAQYASSEGWVFLNFMVNTKGKAFEPVEIDSEGGWQFEKSAIKAIMGSKFTPASLNGDPIISSTFYQYRFSLASSRVTNKVFIKKFNNYSNEIENGSQEELIVLLDDLILQNSKTHYEYSLLNWSKYLFAKKFGTNNLQLEYLWKTFRDQNAKDYLPESLVTVGLREKFDLEVSLNRFAEAISTYEVMQSNDDVEGISLYKPIYDELISYKDNDKAYGMDIVLDNDGFYFLKLYKNNIYLDQIIGKVDEFKLRCSKKYISINIDPDLDYKIPDSWGSCTAEVIGKPNSSFVLVQY